MTIRRTSGALALIGATLLSGSALAQSEITIGPGIFPESIASTDDGSLLIGSFTTGTVFRVAPGATTAEPWLTGVAPIITGVFADGDTAYVCANGAFGSNEAAFKTYSLASGEETGSYAFPDGGFCSDFAVAPDGTVYVTHLNFVEGQPGRLLRLDGDTLEVVLSDPAIAGIDGIAFLGDTLIGNNLTTGELFRVNLGEDPATYTVLTLSEPLMGPDGMRTTEDGTALLIAEQYNGRISRVTVDGDNATVTTVGEGFMGPAGVAQIGDTAYVVEARFDAMQSGQDPGVFTVKTVDLTP